MQVHIAFKGGGEAWLDFADKAEAETACARILAPDKLPLTRVTTAHGFAFVRRESIDAIAVEPDPKPGPREQIEGAIASIVPIVLEMLQRQQDAEAGTMPGVDTYHRAVEECIADREPEGDA